MAHDLQLHAFVAAGEGKEGLGQAAQPAGFPADDADALFRPLRVPFECPLVEHPGVTAYSGERRAQLVTGIGGEASLTLQSLLPADEGGLEASEQSVYRDDQAPDLVIGVGHGQPLGEISLAHPAGGVSNGVHRPQGSSRQQVGAPDGQEKGPPDDERQHGCENLEDLLSFVVGLAKLNLPTDVGRLYETF